MDKWNLIVDVARCENCHNCVLATKDEHIGNEFPGYAASQPEHGHEWIRILRRVRGEAPMVDCAYLPVTCNHCDDAPCVRAARNGAVVKRPDGIVVIDPEKARGQRDLVGSCPYGAISWNEERQLPQKWIFDAHLLDSGWKEPRCVQACPTGALRSVKVSDGDMAEMARAEKLEVLKPELGVRPRVYYQNLHRFNRCFIGGSVVSDEGGTVECLAGADVTLTHGGCVLARAVTDSFGDFKFDDLSPGSEPYRVDIEHGRHGKQTLAVELEESRYLGTIRLGRSGS